MSDRAIVVVEGSKASYRASMIGACARALVGLRMGMDPLPPSKDALRRFADGHLHEDSILAGVENDIGQTIVRRQEAWQFDVSERVAITGHVDGVTSDDLMPVEAKSASKDSFKDWELGTARWFDVHPTYADQWTSTLAAFGRLTGIYAVKNKDSGLVIWREVEAPGTMAEIKVRLLRADLDGRRGKLPGCDRKSAGFWCPLRYLHDDDDREQITDDELEGMCRSYREASEARDRAESVRKELSGRIGVVMGDRERVRVGEFNVTMVGWRRKRWDEQKLAATVGDMTPYEVWSTGSYPKVSEVKGGMGGGEDDPR